MASLEEGAFVLLRKLSYRTKAVSFAGLLYKCNSILAKVCPIAPSKGIYVEKTILLTPEHCKLMCNCNATPSCEEKHWSLHQSFVLQWALSAIAMELYHGQSTFNPSALKRASCLICGATQGNKAALAGNLTQAFCQRPWLRKKRDFFFSISYKSWKGQLRRGTSMLADVEYL